MMKVTVTSEDPQPKPEDPQPKPEHPQPKPEDPQPISENPLPTSAEKAAAAASKALAAKAPAAMSEAAVESLAVDRSIAKVNASKIITTAKMAKKTMRVKLPAAKGATNYIIAYKKASAKKWTYYTTGGKAFYDIKKLNAGSLVQFKVSVVKNGKRGNWSAVSYRFFKGMSKLKVTAGSEMFAAKWAKVAKVTGYQVFYSTSKSIKGAKMVNVKGAKKIKKVVRNLKKGTTYYVSVRPYKKAGGKTYLGTLSKKKVKIK